MNTPSVFLPATARTARAAEITGADWGNGMNWGGSNAPGIGIATENPALSESLPNWTLLDQTLPSGDARAPQVSQPIGGNGYVDRDPATTFPGSGGVAGKGTEPVIDAVNPAYSLPTDAPTTTGDMSLLLLATGWEVVP